MSAPEGGAGAAAAPAWTTILVRYGELGIKSFAVRARWEKRFVENIEGQLARRGAEGEVVRERGRVFVRTPSAEKAIDALRHTFGVVSVSVAEEMPSGAEAIEAHVAAASRGAIAPGQSFAVRARRQGEHAYTSMELAQRVGAAVYRANAAIEPRVDLSDPDVEFFLEVRDNKAYFYRSVVQGPGGIPLGTQGRVVVVLDSPRAALAAWLFMKRGTTPLFLAPEDAVPEEACRALARWSAGVRVVRVAVPAEWDGDAARRRAFLVRAAGAMARPRKGQAVVLADGLTGVAAFAPLDGLAGLPVFRPLAGYEGKELEALAAAAEVPGVAPEPADLPEAPALPVPPEPVRDALRRATTWEARLA